LTNGRSRYGRDFPPQPCHIIEVTTRFCCKDINTSHTSPWGEVNRRGKNTNFGTVLLDFVGLVTTTITTFFRSHISSRFDIESDLDLAASGVVRQPEVEAEAAIMLVLVRGDPAFTKTEVIGLDILAPRHPKLYSLIVGRLGYEINSTTNVVST
jgi:hypothetical protein